jgi:RimJ/RimL family protein N-acetyltransferase
VVESLGTERLILRPLRVSDADEMFSVLNDASLHTFIGGEPGSLQQLKSHYARLEAGSGRATETWLNWIARRRLDGAAIGTVQATILAQGAGIAEVAWVIGTSWQRQGYATEAAGAMVGWLWRRGVERIQAHIHLDHQASAIVARRLGMQSTSVQHDGETQWEIRRHRGEG